MDFRYERFNTIYDFEKALNTREVNSAHKKRGERSHDDEIDFFETKSYSEAEEFLDKGWNTEVAEIERELKKFMGSINIKKNRQIKSPVGYAPCVANAIRGVPKSMFATQTVKVKKRNHIHLILNNTTSGDVKGSTLLKAGMTVLKLAVVLDRMGVRTKIDVIPKISWNHEKAVYGCSVGIKDYRQPLNISKIAYPVAHPSFFRRHGFRYFETLENYDPSFAENYGQSLMYVPKEISDAYIKFAGFMEDDVVYINFGDCENAGFDYAKLAENKGIAL